LVISAKNQKPGREPITNKGNCPKLPSNPKTNKPTQGKAKSSDLRPDCPASIHRFPHKALQILKTGLVNNAYSLGLSAGRMLSY
jgi:hypothetical protein